MSVNIQFVRINQISKLQIRVRLLFSIIYIPMKKEQHELGFAIDIDGTIMMSHQQIQGASEALNRLDQLNVPFILVTNNIARDQQAKADEINKTLKNLNKPIEAHQVILNITPLKTFKPWGDKTVLIVIRQKQHKSRLPFEQIPNYITIEEYCSIFPQAVPLSGRKFDERAQNIKEQVQKRLRVQNITKQTLKIGGVIVLNCPNRWEECYQIIIDLMSSEDGSIHNIEEYKYVENHIPVITALNDLYMKTKGHNLPRILIKPFNEGLKSVYKEIYGMDLEIQTFGKPESRTYHFTKKIMEKHYGKVNKIVMLGDNERTDIVGASNVGWESVLIKTGVTMHDSEIATHTVKNLPEALSKYGLM